MDKCGVLFSSAVNHGARVVGRSDVDCANPCSRYGLR